MSTWELFSLEARIREILSAVPLREPDHHFGHPFLTAYQIAIAFAALHHADYEAIGLEIGGRDMGERDLNLEHVRTLDFDFGDERIETSTEPLSMFRFTGASRR